MTAPPDAHDQRIDALFARFSERPTDLSIFLELERELRAAGRHLHLAGAYEVRLQSLRDPGERSDLLLTLAEVLDSDLRAPRAALKRLKEARALTPQHPEVLRRLRQLLVRQGDAMAALQIAEDEERLELPPVDRAAMLVETAQLWTVLGEQSEVRSRLEEALRLDPNCEIAQYELNLLDAEAGATAQADAPESGEPAPPAGEALSPSERPRGTTPPEPAESQVEAEEPAQLAEEPQWELPPDFEPTAEETVAAAGFGTAQAQTPPTAQISEELPAGSAAASTTPNADPGAGAGESISAEEVSPSPPRAEELAASVPETAQTSSQVEGELSEPDLTPDFEAALDTETPPPPAAVPEGPASPGPAAAPVNDPEAAPVDAHSLELQADACAQSGDLAGWIRALEALDVVVGSSYERALQLTELYELSGDAERAPRPLEAWFESHDDDPAGLGALERCYNRLGRHEERREVLVRQIEVRRSASEGARSAHSLGDLLLRELQDPEGAERAFRQALELSPADDLALEPLRELMLDAGRHECWIDLLAESAQRIGSGLTAAERTCKAADHAIGQSQFTRARALYIEALGFEPCHPEAIAGLRRLETETGDSEAARAACEAELRADPPQERRPALYRELHDHATALGDLETAERAARAWSECEDSIAPWRALLELAEQSGNLERERQALESVEGYLGDPSERAECRVRLGQLAEATAGPLATPNALRWYRDALELDRRSPARSHLLRLLRADDRINEIGALLERELDEGIAEDPIATRLELARLWSEAGNHERAADALLSTFFEHPEHTELADLLEATLAHTEDLESRVSVLDRRVTAAQDPLERRAAALRLAELYLDRLARPGDAIEVLREHAREEAEGEVASLYERALVAAGEPGDQITWYERKQETCSDPEERCALLARLANLHEREDDLASAIECLERIEELAPAQVAELATRPLLRLLRRVAEPEAMLDRLRLLSQAARTARGRAAFVLERARIQLDVGNPAESMLELDRLPKAVALKPCEWRLVCDLTQRAGDAPRQRTALETLVEVSEPGPERQALRLQLAEMYLGEIEDVRDPDRGEAILYELVEDPGVHQAAAEKLAELLIQTGRRRARAELLERRLVEPGLCVRTRRVLVGQLAELYLELGAAAEAQAVLESERERGGPDRELDRLLGEALSALGLGEARDTLYRERVLTAKGTERVQWLRRWLSAHERAEAAPETRLEVIERWLAFVGSDPELEQRRIGLLRETGRLEPLAHALEDQLATDAHLTPGRQAAIIRELLRTYEGPLEAPKRALRLAERELDRHPELRREAARLAARLGDRERERIHLEGLCSENEGDDGDAHQVAEWNRRLALLMVEQGRGDEAREALRSALRDFPHDRELLAALDPIERGSLAPTRLLELLDQRYPLESGVARTQLVREAFAIAEQLCDAMTALRWVRRWRLEEAPPLDTLKRWVSLERAVGDPAGLHAALAALAEATPDPEARALILGERAALYAERGEHGPAADTYAQALELAPRRSLHWLGELACLAKARGDTARQLELLLQIARHPEASPEEHAAAIEERVHILGAQPDERDRAAQELRELIAGDANPNRATRADRLRQLLELYAALGETRLWCDTAEQLVPICDANEAAQLRRELARRLETLAARAPTIGLWQSVLEQDPTDEEALAALVRLLDRSGEEEQRARVLETWAKARGNRGTDLWIEAAELRWQKLGDAEGALRALEPALALDPLAFTFHALRVELCSVLQRPEPEEESLRVLVEAEPETDSAAPRWLRLVELVHQRKGSDTEIANTLERALGAMQPGDPLRSHVRRWYAHLGRWDEVAELLREEVDAGGPSTHDALRELARVEWEERARGLDACRAYEELASADPLLPEDEDRWALALQSLERTCESLPHRQRALTGLGQRARAQDWYELAQDLLEQEKDEAAARDAAARALELDSECFEALELRVRLDASLGRSSDELTGTLALATKSTHPGETAALLARASRLSLELQDFARAAELAAEAIEADPNCIDALWCAGEAADLSEDPTTSERSHGRLCQLLTDTPNEVVRAARAAARAARALGRTAAASHYLDVALAVAPDDLDVLADLRLLSHSLGHHERVRECLEALLEHGKLDDSERHTLELELADACFEVRDLDAAAKTLEHAQAVAPIPAEAWEKLVSALEQLGETDRALHQLEAWDEASPERPRQDLALRAARAEVAAERFEAADTRLRAALANDPKQPAAWLERARIAARVDGPGKGLELYAQAREHGLEGRAGASLCWHASCWASELDDRVTAREAAGATLDLEPSHLEAAVALAQDLRERAARDVQSDTTPATGWGEINALTEALAPDIARVEHALESGVPAATVAAELEHALGCAYAACCDWIPACNAYRRAVAHNPQHDAAREALADLGAYQSDTQREAAELHRELLQSQPTRQASWRALQHVADRLGRARAAQTCQAVLEALGYEATSEAIDATGRDLLLGVPPSQTPAAAASELMQALGELHLLPVGQDPSLGVSPLGRLADKVQQLTGGAFSLPDAVVARIARQSEDDLEEVMADVPRLKRRRPRKAHRALSDAGIFAVETWRIEVLTQAASQALAAGTEALTSAMLALLSAWPATRHLNARSKEQRAAAISVCPPARLLLARMAAAVLDSL